MDPDTLILGFTIEQIESATLTVLVTALILYMVFIIGNLAYKSKAGKYGTLWLFVALGVGFVGFISKAVIQRMLGIE